MNKLLQLLHAERQNLMVGSFTQPPSTWEEFQRRLGEYIGLTRAIDKIEQLLENPEDNP